MDEMRLQEYIRSYQELLTEKGYDEKSIGGDHPSGSMNENLEKAFREANKAISGMASNEGIGIDFMILYKTESEQNPIGIRFVFVLNPTDDTISIRNIDAHNGILPVTILPQTNSSIPTSKELSDLFKDKEVLNKAMDMIKKHSARKGRGHR